MNSSGFGYLNGVGYRPEYKVSILHSCSKELLRVIEV